MDSSIGVTPSIDASARQVLSLARSSRGAFVDLLTRLAAIETPSDRPETLSAAFELLSGAFRELNYRVLHLPGRRTAGHLYASPRDRRPRQPVQLLLGHCDTVWPVGTLRRMPLRLDGRTLRGPGVFDMKGGLVQVVFALRILDALHLEPSVAPVVLFTSDEEIGSIESRRHIERLARVADRALVLEPGLGRDGKIKTARKGVGEFEISVTGKAAHAGVEPEKGASAILELSYIVQKLFALNDPAAGVTVNVGTLDGGIRPNVVAPTSRITVDVRVPTMDAAATMERAVHAIEPSTPNVSLRIDGGFDRPPMERTPRNQALWEMCASIGASLGLSLEEGMSGGASDGNFTSLLTATLDGLGSVGDGAHADHEFIDVDASLDRIALLALLLLAPPVQPLPDETSTS